MDSLVPYNQSDPTHRSSVAAARAALETDRYANDEPLDEEAILVGEEVVYLPSRFTGSVGVLYEVSSGQLARLGSHVGLDDFLWARSRGMNLCRSQEQIRPDKLRITAVHDPKQALSQLRLVFPDKRPSELPDLSHLPAIVDGVDLYFSIRTLRKAEASGVMEFEIERASARAPDQDRL